MTIQFKDTDNQVQIQTEFNTRHIYLKPNNEIDRRRTLVALLKYRLYEQTAGLREARDAWAYRLAWASANLRPSVVAGKMNLRFKLWLHRRTAVVRHYMGIVRMNRYSL
jgi:hypothetical protein